jgi:hypothetical protein
MPGRDRIAAWLEIPTWKISAQVDLKTQVRKSPAPPNRNFFQKMR